MRSRTQRSDAHTEMHCCGGHRGLLVPLIEVRRIDDKPDAQHVEQEREDYIGDSNAPRIMSVRTDHGDGSNDATVYAPTANMAVTAVELR